MKQSVINGISKIVYNKDDTVSLRSIGNWKIELCTEVQVLCAYTTAHVTLGSAICIANNQVHGCLQQYDLTDDR